MNNNTIDTLLGNNIAPIVFVQGFTRVSHSSNNISNCGRYIYFAAILENFYPEIASLSCIGLRTALAISLQILTVF